jgi:mono/diheme cytochrome c family protein
VRRFASAPESSELRLTCLSQTASFSAVMLRGAVLVCLLMVGIAAQETRQGAKRAQAAKGPLPYTRESIARGKQFYLISCVECHDQDGKGLGRRDFSGTAPADLTDPEAWVYGTTPQAIFTSIREGTKKDMPPFKDRLQDEQIWNVVNFVRSLWPEGKRPKLETKSEEK